MRTFAQTVFYTCGRKCIEFPDCCNYWPIRFLLAVYKRSMAVYVSVMLWALLRCWVHALLSDFCCSCRSAHVWGFLQFSSGLFPVYTTASCCLLCWCWESLPDRDPGPVLSSLAAGTGPLLALLQLWSGLRERCCFARPYSFIPSCIHPHYFHHVSLPTSLFYHHNLTFHLFLHILLDRSLLHPDREQNFLVTVTVAVAWTCSHCVRAGND